MENHFYEIDKEEKIFSKPTPSRSYYLLMAIGQRRGLTSVEARKKNLFEIGMRGEQQFHKFLQERLVAPHIAIYNLQLEVNMSEFQLDCLLIFHNLIHLVEVKNFNDNFIAKDDHWLHVKSKDPVKSPLHQLSRANTSLKSWLKLNRISLPILPHLIFMNPGFYLYGAAVSMPIIFPSQHNSYLQLLHKNSRSLDNQHEQLASKLKAAHIVESRHEYIPKYSYCQLKKGIFCKKCSAILPKPQHNYFQCKRCGKRELIGEALYRMIKEFQLLFPEISLQVNRIKEWTGGILSNDTIRRCLFKKFQRQGRGRGTYYL